MEDSSWFWSAVVKYFYWGFRLFINLLYLENEPTFELFLFFKINSSFMKVDREIFFHWFVDLVKTNFHLRDASIHKNF